MGASSSPHFDFEAKIDFEWKQGSVLELFRTPGVGKLIKKETDKVYNKAMANTPKPGPKMTNPNYYTDTYLGGKLNLWRGRVWTGNVFSQRWNKRTNVLLRSMH